MKTLLISLVFTCTSMSLFAQADTTSTVGNNTYNNSTYTDSTGTLNNNANNNTNMNNVSSNADSSAYINNSTNRNNSSMINNWNDSMQNNNTAMAKQKAALPVRETFVPQNIIDQAKQKYPDGQIYDITAVKSPEDTMTQSSNAMNSRIDPDHDNDIDSSHTNMNQRTMNTQDSSINQTTANNQATINNYNNSSSGYANNSAPEKYDYVVRVMQGGQMVSETLTSNGTALNVKNPSTMTTGQLTSQ